MTEKITALKDAFSELSKLCQEIPSPSLQDALSALLTEMESLRSDDDVEEGLSLLSEVLMHVNDLDEEFAEGYEETIMEINEMAEDIRADQNCS